MNLMRNNFTERVKKMNDKKRTIALAGVMLALVAYAIPNVILKNSGEDATSNIASSTANDTSKSTVKNNKASANKQKSKGISKDKLEIDNLIKSTYALKSTELTNVTTNPFLSSNDNAKALQDKEKILQEKEKKNNKLLPKTIGIESGGDHIGNNVVTTSPSMQVEAPKAPAGDFKLKAIAQANDKVIAVVESGGKRTTAFIGSTIGSYTITDIDSQHVYMQSDNGFTKTLDLVK